MTSVMATPEHLRAQTVQQLADRLAVLACAADLVLLELQERMLTEIDGFALSAPARHLAIVHDGVEQLIYEACVMLDARPMRERVEAYTAGRAVEDRRAAFRLVMGTAA